jgi:hypothetical protein
MAWLVMLGVVTIPAFVKFLPVFARPPRLDISTFLFEFIPASAPEHPADLHKAEEIRALARNFARNSMWPTGDGPARLLFFFAFFVLGWILVPLPLAAPGDVLAQFIVALGATAAAAVTGVLVLLKYLLGAVNLNLVKTKD